MALGGFVQQALVHENMLVELPKDMPFAQAAVLGCGVITGTGAVLNAAKVKPGKTLSSLVPAELASTSSPAPFWQAQAKSSRLI